LVIVFTSGVRGWPGVTLEKDIMTMTGYPYKKYV